MACFQPACLGAACGPTLGGWAQRDGVGGAGRTLPAEALRPRNAGGNGICCTASSWWNEQEYKHCYRARQLRQSKFLGAGCGHHQQNAAFLPPPISLQQLCHSPSASYLASRALVDLHCSQSSKSQPHSRFQGWRQHSQKSRSVAARAGEDDAERPSGADASTSSTEQGEPPQTSDSARGRDPNEPEERYGKGPYPNPYPVLPRELQQWQKPKRDVLPGYEIHYHEDGRRFTEEEEEEFELQRKLGVVDAAYAEYDRECAEAFARGDFAPIPPPRLMRLPAKVSNLIQTARDGMTYMVPDANVYDPGISLEDALANMRAAVGYDDYHQQGIVTVSGTQELFKMEGQYTWLFEVRTGRFFEQWKSPQLSTSLGWNGNQNASVWDANMQGKVRLLDLDDLEVVHLAHWVRSGYYLNRSLEAKRVMSLSIPNYQPEPGEFLLRIRMTKKLIKGTIVFDRETWLPKRLTMKVFGTCEERWEFNDWRRMKPGLACLHPVEVIKEHVGSAGRTMLRVETFETRPPLSQAEENEELPFDVPIIPYQVASPEDPAPRQSVKWVGDDIVDVQMIRTESGHNLVRPLVDGQDIGLYVVDTGASIMTITKEHAARLGMEQFGEINVVTATGEFPAPFRRGRTWQLGPVVIGDPLFMEVDHLAELVTGYDPALGAVVGAVGHDLFFSATVHMRLTEAGTNDAGIRLQRPEKYEPLPDDASLMQRVQMIGGCPVARGTFGRYTDLFLVDTGAGGVDLIFNKRGVAKYDLLNARRRRGNMRIKGVSPFPGQEQSAARLFSAEIPFVLGGYTFKQPKQALLCIEENMFDISEYVVGVICGELLEGSRIIFDYPRLRWAIIRDPIPGEEKAPYDYEFVTEWESLFGHNEELAQPVGFELNNNPLNS